MISQKVIIEAGKFLSGDNIEEQVIQIMEHKCDIKTTLIDYIGDVTPCQKFEHRITVSEFLDMMPFESATELIERSKQDAEIIKVYGAELGGDIVEIRNRKTDEFYKNSDKVRDILVVLAIDCKLEGDMNAFDTNLINFID